MRYSTILFDADGTLLDFKRAEYESAKEMMAQFGIIADDAMISKYSEINDSLWKMLEKGEIEKKVLLYKRFQLFCEHYGFECNGKMMAEAYKNILATKSYIFEGADKLCADLYGKVKMYIVTNGLEFTQRGRFKTCEITKYFDDIFISGVIGFEKPDINYFIKVEKIAKFDKSKTLIVGDSLSSDIKGGLNYGIDTCWYNPNLKPIPDGMKITHVASDFDSIYNFITG